MKFHLLVFIILTVFLSCNSEQKKVTKDSKAESFEDEAILNNPPNGYETLFNGENFNGWNIITDNKESDVELFSIENGMIQTYKDLEANSLQPFGELITEKEYKNYILTLEYKWGDKKFKPRHEAVRDAGVLFHAFEESIFWASGAECQIQEGDTGDLWLIGVRGSTKIDASNGHYAQKGKVFTKGKDPKKRYQSFARNWFWENITGWNKIVIEVKGDKATFMVNGKLVNEVFDLGHYDEDSKEWKTLKKGKILLQAEGAEIYYRNIYLKQL
ncbi:3-keto-disaccharide hydrolase [Maribacter arcticus]|uniref:3-keto-alpha-glucoside-1,2-lyase/3-keto-2-hydroxy-glucal hydratase domain-containing protein n=1 Tax=Maribacter arcticus TaxID=561365 RepID=A0A1T5CJ32_9FLAO|nr:DUF1080 domain-containing protein [Maribacter arcticus]SKB59478.1 protein of unknown function [Maribacter arcticus]